MSTAQRFRTPRHLVRRRLSTVYDTEDAGQLLLLVLAYALIAALLVTVVVNVSKAYLYRRALVAAVDAAALTAANQPDLDRLYSGTGNYLPLSRDGATAAVRQYVHDADLENRFDGFRVIGVTTDGRIVTVQVRAVARMPFINLLSGRYAAGYPIDATARARSPLLP